jgi:signal transduction histidine kinase
VIGHPEVFRQLYHPALAKENMRRMRSDEYGPPDKLEPTRIFLVSKDGEKVPVNFSAAIIKEGDKELGSVGIFSDLREHLRIQKELEEARLQLVQAEKIASLGRLAAGVAHEINNPLAGILIYADMLIKETVDKPEWRSDLEEIINQTLRCKEIVTRLLEFSRQSLGEQVLLDVNETLRKNIEMLSHQTLFHDIEMVEEYEPDLPHVLGDPGQLQQVFTNLLLNAADAMEGKGRMTVSTRCERQTGELVLKFSDTGKGIDPEMRDKIFDPFFTTKPPGKGTGLGLSIVYGVIQRHGGKLGMKSAPGQGTTFTIRLPLKGKQETADSENPIMDLDEESSDDSLFLLD